MATYTYTILTSPPAAPTARLASVTGIIPAGPVFVDFWYNPDDKVTYTITECNPVFLNQTLITSVSMPYVTNILANTPTNNIGICQGCTALTSFSAPQLQQLNCVNAFQSCPVLVWANINLGSITSLPESTFRGCTTFTTNVNVASITSGTVTSIGAYCFAQIPSLSTSGLALGAVTSLATGMFQDSFTTSVSLLNLNISSLSGSIITQIGDLVFQRCIRIGTVIGPTVTTMGNSVYQGCTGLTTFSGISLTSIGTDTFNGCTSLQSTSISSINLGAVTAIPARTFLNCTSIAEITFQNVSTADITTIGDNAFQGCTSMTIFDGRYGIIPSGIKTLGTGVFYGCTSLNQALLGAVSVIPAQTFYGCSSLNTFIGGFINFGAGALSDLNITSIGSEAFYSCTTLTTVIGTSFLSSIGTAAFKLCSNLTSAITLGTITSLSDELFRQTSIGKSFGTAGPLDLASIFINPITTLGNNVFNGCVFISSFTGSALTSIGTDTFNGCSALTSVNLGAVSTLPARTFNSCTSLIKINLGLISTNAITTLGDNAFSNCTAMTSFSGPSVTTMGGGVFNSCSLLVKFFLGAQSPPTYTSSIFTSTPLLNYVCFDSRYSANWQVGIAPYLYDAKNLTAYQRINITAPSTAFQNAQQLVTVVSTGGAPPFGVPSLNESANWYKNNSAIPGEQSPSLIILQATPPAAYQYIVQNDFEKVYSDIFEVDNYITANRFTIMYRPVILPPQPYF